MKNFQNLKILKFGGTSMGTVESLKNVVRIIQKNDKQKQPQVIVCSAMSGVTNQLLDIGRKSEQTEFEKVLAIFYTLKEKHLAVAQAFGVEDFFCKAADPIFQDLENLIRGLCLIHELSSRSEAYLVAFGEKLSTRLLTEILKKSGIGAVQQDSNFIHTKGIDFQEDEVDWDKSISAINQQMKPLIESQKVPIITGFFGSNPNGNVSALGRGGSDYSASILAVALKSSVLEIWTDVDGFLSADPRIIKNAQVIDSIGFFEASELCAFGAKVLHPKTIRPMICEGGEVWIKNTFFPEKIGTRIVKTVGMKQSPVLSVTSKPVSVLSLDLFGVRIGVHKSQVYKQIFEICCEYSVCIDMIASSETEVSFCVADTFVQNKLFMKSLESVAPLKVNREKTIICLVSPSEVKDQVGIAALFFVALKNIGVSVEMFSQNNSEIAQLMLVDQKDEKKSLQAFHDEFVKESTLND